MLDPQANAEQAERERRNPQETTCKTWRKYIVQKLPIIQALLLKVETVKARVLPSGERSGEPSVEVEVHSEVSLPEAATWKIEAPRMEELVTSQPLPSGDQEMPERRCELSVRTSWEEPS